MNMKNRRKILSGAFAGLAIWIVISAFYGLPPAGQIYIGQSLISCTAVLKEIETMKAIYAEDKGLKEGESFGTTDFHSHFKGRIPKCPGGGNYTYNPIGVQPTCSFAGTSGLKPKKKLVKYFFWRWEIPPSGRHER